MLKRIIALFCAFAILFCSFVPYALADFSSQGASYWEKAWEDSHGIISIMETYYNSHKEEFACYWYDDSGDHYNSNVNNQCHCQYHQFGGLPEVVSGQLSLSDIFSSVFRRRHFSDVTCNYCHKTLVQFLNEVESAALHDNSLDSGVSVSPDGGILWRPKWTDRTAVNDISMKNIWSFHVSEYTDTNYQYTHVCSYLDDFSFKSELNPTSELYAFEKGMDSIERYEIFFPSFNAPVSGLYTMMETVAATAENGASVSYPLKSGRLNANAKLNSYSIYGSSSLLFNANCSLSAGHINLLHYYLPVFRISESNVVAPSVPQNITINNNTYQVTDIDFNLRTVHVDNNKTIIYDDDKVIIKQGDTVIEEHNYYIENPDPGEDPADSSGSGSGSAAGGSGCCEQCALLLRQANQYLLQIQTLVDQINDKLGPDSDNYMQGIYNLLVEINNALDNLSSDSHPDYESTLTTICNQLANIWGDLDDIKSSLSAVQTNTATTNQKLDTVHTDLEAVLAELQTQRGILSQILSVLREMLGHITSIDSNVEELANEEDSQSFFDSFILKFHFIGDIFSIIRQLFADITNDAATVTFVDNGDLPIGDLSSRHFPVSGSPVPVGTAPQVLIKFPSDTYHGADLSGYSAIDMSWYAPYKSRVDALISGFLWIGYLWLLFKRAPGIVRGAAMIEETNYKIEDWKNGG